MVESPLVYPVMSFHIPSLWKTVRPWIKRAIEAEDIKLHNEEDIYTDLMTKDMQLWVMDSACVVTQIQVYPRAKICVIVLCGGSGMGGWVDGIREIEEWAKAEGCDAMKVHGRSGWEKVLNRYGYERSAIVLQKVIA